MTPLVTYLRIPGPTPLPDAVREAGARQMVNHRGPEFKALLGRVTIGLKAGFRTGHDVLVLTASGTGALEAAVVNHCSPGDPVLAVSIGAFGDRFAKIAARYGADVTRLDVPWGQAATPEALTEALRAMRAAGRPAHAVLLTHNETSTAVTNPIADLAAAARATEPDALLLVDGISGLGAIPFETDEWGLDVVTTGSQKSLDGATRPGHGERLTAGLGGGRAAQMPRFYFDLAPAPRRAWPRARRRGRRPWGSRSPSTWRSS